MRVSPLLNRRCPDTTWRARHAFQCRCRAGQYNRRLLNVGSRRPPPRGSVNARPL